jgi:hypothetical protein
LAEIERKQKPVSGAVLHEAMAVFGPAEHAISAALAPGMAAAKATGWHNWGWGAIAAVLVAGMIGGAQLWQFVRSSANTPATIPLSTSAAPKAAPQGTAAPAPPPPDQAAPRASDPSKGDCNAAVPGASSEQLSNNARVPTGSESAKVLAQRTPCPSSSQGPGASPAPLKGGQPPQQETPPQGIDR